MYILTISFSYPSDAKPYHGIFVKNLMHEFVRQGHQVTVIAPQNFFSKKHEPYSRMEESLKVYRPKFSSFGAFGVAALNSYQLTQYFFELAVMRVINREMIDADVVYSHFMLPSGKAAIKAGDLLGKPTFCTIGESSPTEHEQKLPIEKLGMLYGSFQKLFFNSAHTKQLICGRYGVSEKECIVVSNGVDTSIFQPRNKREARKKLGLPLEEKIVIFVGSFIERKGPLRVLEACRQVPDAPKMLFIGSGPQMPNGEDVLFVGDVEQTFLPWYLSAADVFVLPTLSEGMPNAVLEAIACGVPIVTSPIPPNRSILGDDYNLFSDPLDAGSIAVKIKQAIETGLKDMPIVPSLKDRAEKIQSVLKKDYN